MHPVFKTITYGLIVFVIYAALTFILRYITNRMPENPEFLGIYTTNDLLLGIAVAFFLTFTHERKKNLKK